MTQKRKTNAPLQWHPALYAGLQVELKDEADKLIFENEHQLSKKPLGIDVLIIKKDSAEPIRKNIGRIFRKHNIIEYKSPTDSLNIDSFYKVYGYACFYKFDSVSADAIKSYEITLTFISKKTPRKLLKHLRLERKADIIKAEQGIYYIEGLYFPIQLIITKELSSEENLWLKSLTDQLKNREDVQNLLSDYYNHQTENLYQAVMDVIVKANENIFEEEKGMCDALRELFEKDFKEREQLAEARGVALGEARGEARGMALGEAREKKKIYSDLIREGILTIQDVAVRLQTSKEEVERMLQAN